MNQRIQVVDKQWMELENCLFQERHPVFSRLKLFFAAAKTNRVLRQLFPYTSHERLCFSFNTAYPWSQDYPCIEPIPNLSEFSILAAMKETSDVEIIRKWLQQFLDKYQFLLGREQSYFVVSEKNRVTGVSDVSKVIEWLLEQSYEMYTVRENSNVDFTRNNILGIGHTQTAIELLITRVKSLNPGLIITN